MQLLCRYVKASTIPLHQRRVKAITKFYTCRKANLSLPKNVLDGCIGPKLATCRMRSCCIGCEKGNTSHDLFFAPCILVSRSGSLHYSLRFQQSGSDHVASSKHFHHEWIGARSDSHPLLDHETHLACGFAFAQLAAGLPAPLHARGDAVGLVSSS